ncbi:hypothetical protein GpartN1_g3661.t1 [Galdieria partita]|uniref:Uncharacterized protein n=1 Tax=Galdieria partita TaxID=83374 RepID=A0A9C7PWL6_9RHOD|nr:hypothetical protein GpartN1_g3661.t1 [Galdieria partita]
MVRHKEVSLVSSYKVESSLSAISCDASERFLVAGGREVLRLFSIENNSLREIRNLRSSRRKGLKYSINDIHWHKQPGYYSLVLSGSTDGSLVLWDLAVDIESANVSSSSISFSYSSFSSRKRLTEPRFITAHERAINKVDWHDTIPNSFLSSSQDGSISLWDLREFGKSNIPLLNMCHSKSDPVRDASFSPHQPYWIGGGYESGNFLLWDIRRPDLYLFNIRAHNGLVFSISWHPHNENIIATGGRDKIIRIWDLSQDERTTEAQGSLDVNKEHIRSAHLVDKGSFSGWQEMFSLMTIAAISKVSWRPGYKEQMASASSVLDTRISIWDIHRPYLPIVSLRGHRDTVSCLLWESSGNLLFSCSKNGAIIIQQVDKGYKPYSRLRNNVFALSTQNSIAFSTYNQPSKEDLRRPLSQNAIYFWKQDESKTLRLKLMYKDDYSPVGGGIGLDESIFRQICRIVSPFLRNKSKHDSLLWEWRISICKELMSLYASVGLSQHEFIWSTFYEFIQLLSDRSSFSYLERCMYTRVRALFECIVVKWWRYFSNVGDVQTCSLILILCWGLVQSSFNSLLDEARGTFTSYLDILRRMEMHVIATEVQNAAPFPEICQWSSSNTMIEDSRTTSCPICSFCHCQVRGLYSWCQGCGHGAHTKCMVNWFVGSDTVGKETSLEQFTCVRSTCPVPSCQHRCIHPGNLIV